MSVSGYAGAVDRLITALGRFPGIGAKSAKRLAHHVLRCPTDEALELADAIRAAKEQIKHCQVCFHLTQADQPVCTICGDARRDHATVCVVEQSRDLMALEKANAFHGVYHVLLGRLAPLSGMSAEQLTIDALVARVQSGTVRESSPTATCSPTHSPAGSRSSLFPNIPSCLLPICGIIVARDGSLCRRDRVSVTLDLLAPVTSRWNRGSCDSTPVSRCVLRCVYAWRLA
jgi:recombination protein RecR